MDRTPQRLTSSLVRGHTPKGDVWIFKSEPHIRMRLRRMFHAALAHAELIKVSCTPSNSEDVWWFIQRYPHEIRPEDEAFLLKQCAQARDQRTGIQWSLTGDHAQPADFAIPLRKYQLQAVALANANHGLLIGDDLGLGKTATAIGVIASAQNRPALVVCAPHLQNQWLAQIAKFCPTLKPHIIPGGKVEQHKFPQGTDVLVCTYSKLAKWQERLAVATVIFDECQELRNQGTGKWNAAKYIADRANVRVGLSASPVYNYGGEIWPIMEIISPGKLGTFDEFAKDWCRWDGRRYHVQDPVALGTFLRAEGAMIRRIRADVDRELPEVIKIPHLLEYDEKVIQKLKANANKLAAAVLAGSFTERGQAARQLDMMLRQATGLAKALSVAEFVTELVKNGQPVVLGGWHREVYEVWMSYFRKHHVTYRLYTGTESPAAKDDAKEDFMSGDADVMILSLRSGAGLDGLQERASVCVFGELDWSPKVHEQFIGRLHRDGQANRVTAFFLMIDNGSDPVVAAILGLKEAQADGIVNLRVDPLQAAPADEDSRLIKLARSWMDAHKVA